MNAGEIVGVDDVGRRAVYDRLLVGVGCIGLVGRDEGRSDIGEIRTHGLGRQHRAAVGDGTRQGKRAIEELADFLDRSEEHTSELQSLMRISYAVFCLKKKKSTISILSSYHT